LNDENTLENASINERNTEERLVSILAGLTEIFEARMIPDLFNGNRTNLLGNESRETLMERHAQSTNTFMAKSKRRRQDKVGSIGLQQVRRTHIGLETPGDQRDDVHQRVGGFSGLLRQFRNFFQSQNMTAVTVVRGFAHDAGNSSEQAANPL